MIDWLQEFWLGLSRDFLDLPDAPQVGQIIGRMLVAAVLAGALGYERGHSGKAAGVRTHMLVALAAAFLVMICGQSGFEPDALSRVMQGLAAGVGFLGAGTILKQSERGRVVGLTTAASLYFTTAVGVACGMGRQTTAILGTLLALLVLTMIPHAAGWYDRRENHHDESSPPNQSRPTDDTF